MNTSVNPYQDDAGSYDALVMPAVAAAQAAVAPAIAYSRGVSVDVVCALLAAVERLIARIHGLEDGVRRLGGIKDRHGYTYLSTLHDAGNLIGEARAILRGETTIASVAAAMDAERASAGREESSGPAPAAPLGSPQ